MVRVAANAASSFLRMRSDRRGECGLQAPSMSHPSTIRQLTADAAATPAYPWEVQCPSIVVDAASLQVSIGGDMSADPELGSGARLQVVQPGRESFSMCKAAQQTEVREKKHTFSETVNCSFDR